MRSTKLLIILAFAGAMAGCATARDEAKGFRLAGSGDLRRGKAAFLDFGCNECHEVKGASHLPSPTIQRVVLGGSVLKLPSDGYMVTAIINPLIMRRFTLRKTPRAIIRACRNLQAE